MNLVKKEPSINLETWRKYGPFDFIQYFKDENITLHNVNANAFFSTNKTLASNSASLLTIKMTNVDLGINRVGDWEGQYTYLA